MPFAVEEFRDLLRILEEHPEWRAQLRQQVLSEGLLRLPEEFAAFRAEARERMERVEQALAALAQAQQRTEEGLATLSATR